MAGYDLVGAITRHAGAPFTLFIGSYSLPSTCHLLKVEIVDRESAWCNTRGGHSGGKSIPLGAYVHFKPSST